MTVKKHRSNYILIVHAIYFAVFILLTYITFSYSYFRPTYILVCLSTVIITIFLCKKLLNITTQIFPSLYFFSFPWMLCDLLFCRNFKFNYRIDEIRSESIQLQTAITLLLLSAEVLASLITLFFLKKMSTKQTKPSKDNFTNNKISIISACIVGVLFSNLTVLLLRYVSQNANEYLLAVGSAILILIMFTMSGVGVLLLYSSRGKYVHSQEISDNIEPQTNQ